MDEANAAHLWPMRDYKPRWSNVALALLLAAFFVPSAEGQGATSLGLGSRRELFVEDYLVDQKIGLRHRLYSPLKDAEVANHHYRYN